MFFGGAGSLLAVILILWLPVIHAWQHRWRPYRSSIGGRPVQVVQVPLNTIMRTAPVLYGPMLCLHAKLCGWFYAQGVDGLYSDEFMEFACYLPSP
jgi:hypothetical protein